MRGVVEAGGARATPRSAASQKPSQRWPIVVRYSSRSCGCMSTTSRRPPGLEHARRFGEHARADRRRSAARARARATSSSRIVDREVLETCRCAARHCRRSPSALSRRGEHGARLVDGDDAADERGERRRRLAGAAAEVADDPGGIEQRSERCEIGAAADTARRGRLSHWPARVEKNDCDVVRRSCSTRSARVRSWRADGVALDLLADEVPEPARARRRARCPGIA